MSIRVPDVEKRRAAQFERELADRAKAWIPDWGVDEDDGPRDFGRALLKVAARFSSEVAERLDKAGEKMLRGFYDWLGIRGEASRPARMPVVFKMAEKAARDVLALAPASLQVGVDNDAVVFETEDDVRLVPGRLTRLVAVDADKDAFYVPPPGFTDIEADVSAHEWRLKTFAASGAKQVQLDAETGLATDLILEIGAAQYRIDKVDKDIVTLDPALEQGFDAGTVVRRVTRFEPFGGARNRQSHGLYVGDDDVLSIESKAAIDVIGAQALATGFKWQYWGKKAGDTADASWLDFGQPVLNAQGDGITLAKPPGSMEERPYGPAKKSRWIRATVQNLPPGAQPLGFESLTLAVNRSSQQPACPAAGAPSADAPTVEAMSNTTPLTITNLFYPLGREPRQFDAFYIGSKEAFSKKNAKVYLCCEMADPTFQRLVTPRKGQLANAVFAGVGNDRALHLFKLDSATKTLATFQKRDALRPPSPDKVKGQTADAPIDLETECVPFVRDLPNDDFEVVVAAGNAVWKWYENAANPTLSGWEKWCWLADESARIDDLVPLDAGNAVAVRSGGKLWSSSGTGLAVATKTLPILASIGPLHEISAGALVAGARLVAVDKDGKLHVLQRDGSDQDLQIGGLDAGSSVDTERWLGGVRPIGVVQGGQDIAVAAASDLKRLYASVGGGAALPMDVPNLTGKDIAVQLVGGEAQFVVARHDPVDAHRTFVRCWIPGHASVKDFFLESEIPSTLGAAAGAPLLAPASILVPGGQQDVFVAPYDPQAQDVIDHAVTDAILTTATSPLLRQDDRIAPYIGGLYEPIAIDRVLFTPANQRAYVMERRLSGTPSGSASFPPLGYRTKDAGLALAVHAYGPPTIVDLVDTTTTDGTTILVYDANHGYEVYLLASMTPASGGTPKRAEIIPELHAADAPFTYWVPEKLGISSVSPEIDFHPVNAWDAAKVSRAAVHFVGSVPESQAAQLLVDSTSKPAGLLLAQSWTTLPTRDVAFIEAAFGVWDHFSMNVPSYPALSWEYWNGTAWWSLPIDEDQTANFRNTGLVVFHVPADLASSDWAGKANYWARARLVAGDYGKEQVVITTVATGTGTVQTVDRKTDGIKPPVMLRLSLSYATEGEHVPDYVLAVDSGSLRDQSDANRTAGAKVEAFVPLAVSLGRLEGSATPARARDGPCPPECECPDASIVASAASTPGNGSVSASAPAATGRALLLGVEGAIEGGPVNLLAMIGDEKDHDALSPMRAAALVESGFAAFPASDATRALSESGLVTMTLGDAPKEAELFGDTRRWIRLGPKPGAGEWNPSLAGLYLNGAWASARETLTRELLGSSEGAPNLVLQLARPPLLRRTLELRVKEPLGEEERAKLLAADHDSVLDDRDLGADWVLWNQVVDPADAEADDRVYALDETRGLIRFGDGQHGRIPPIGRNSIVAFRYQRTQPPRAGATDVPGNGVEARAKLDVVTPLEGVEGVFAAEHSAGGTPPEPDDRVLRFATARLRHRERAVSLEDFADLALESSPAIAQARALRRGTATRLVVVMRGAEPKPTRPQRRELQRLLAAAAPPTLAGALTIAGPRLRRLHLELALRVERLDDAGRVQRDVESRLLGFFDSATGGRSGAGWALGDSPTEDDVAHALLDIPNVESIEGIELYEMPDGGTLRPWPGALQPDELAILAAGAVRFAFVAQESAA